MATHKVTWKTASQETRTTWAVTFRQTFPSGTIRKVYKQGFKTKKDAEAWERIKRDQLARALSAPKGSQITMAQLCEQWLNSSLKGLGEHPPIERTAWKDYDVSVRLHISPRIGDLRLKTFDAPAAVAFRKRLLDEVTRAKAQRVLKHLRQALNFAVVAGYIPANPTVAVKIVRGTREQAEPKIPSRTEMQMIVRELVARADAKPQTWTRFTAMFILLQGSGLRMSEARGLAWRNVDLSERTLKVTQRLDNLNVMGAVKSAASNRVVTLDTFQVVWLKRWKPLCAAGELDLVFPNQQGRPENYSNLHARFWKPLLVHLKLIDENGTAHFSFHSARHYRVSELIASGANVREVMGAVGHASSALTLDRYGHLFPEDLNKQRERDEKINQNLSRYCQDDTPNTL
jgi:integrase